MYLHTAWLETAKSIQDLKLLHLTQKKLSTKRQLRLWLKQFYFKCSLIQISANSKLPVQFPLYNRFLKSFPFPYVRTIKLKIKYRFGYWYSNEKQTKQSDSNSNQIESCTVLMLFHYSFFTTFVHCLLDRILFPLSFNAFDEVLCTLEDVLQAVSLS